jgi:putative hydrolase of the HAD superfamily
MATRAVVFDFYGTLSVSATRAERRAGAARVAAALDIPAEELHATIAATFTERATGARGDLEQTMRWLAGQCRRTPTSEQLDVACAIRRATEEVYARALRDDAEPTLRALRGRGIRLGVLSDCTHELPEIWSTLPIAPYVDATVFSVQVGMRKPHPDLYTTVARSLGVVPAECVYVGDGGSGELTGAAQAGMTPLHLVAADAAEAVIYDADAEWAGPTIQALSEVLDLI